MSRIKDSIAYLLAISSLEPSLFITSGDAEAQQNPSMAAINRPVEPQRAAKSAPAFDATTGEASQRSPAELLRQLRKYLNRRTQRRFASSAKVSAMLPNFFCFARSC